MASVGDDGEGGAETPRRGLDLTRGDGPVAGPGEQHGGHLEVRERGLEGLESAISKVLQAESSEPRRQTSQLAAAE